jgi:hypothetical protein
MSALLVSGSTEAEQLVVNGPARVWNKRFSGVPREAMYVGRPTMWGNPIVVRPGVTHKLAVAAFTLGVLESEDRDFQLIRRGLFNGALMGRELVCWCTTRSGAGVCHAKVLAQMDFQIRVLGFGDWDLDRFWYQKLEDAGHIGLV